MKIVQAAAAVIALALSGSVAAQAAKSLKDQIVGSWEFVVAEVTAPDGKKSPEEFVNTNPNVAGGRGSASNFYKRAK